jgi:ComF family protein
MHLRIQKYVEHFTHLFYPHNCIGCGADTIGMKHMLCTRCSYSLPETHFFEKQNNPVEKIFHGRIPVEQAGTVYYFTKNSLMQQLLVQLKYKGNIDVGYFLGRKIGYGLLKEPRYRSVDMLIPLPLNPKKEFIRGYNQSALICDGIREIWQRPVRSDLVTRVRFTETQTHQNRISRWQNMEGVFRVLHPELLENKHLLLVDDVITTGATLEACGKELLKIPGVRLSVAAAGYTV